MQGVSININRVTDAAAEASSAAIQVIRAATELSPQSEALGREVDRFIAEVKAA